MQHLYSEELLHPVHAPLGSNDSACLIYVHLLEPYLREISSLDKARIPSS
jgi:hypothetical protein